MFKQTIKESYKHINSKNLSKKDKDDLIKLTELCEKFIQKYNQINNNFIEY